MGKQITPSELVAKLQYYKYVVSFDTTELGPLNSPPKVEADIETHDVVLYETGADPLATILTKNNAKITIECCNVSEAMKLLKDFKKGEDLLNSEKGKALTLVPIVGAEDGGAAETLTFPKAFLQPGLSTNFAEGDDPNYITLEFIAKQGEDGVLFKFEAGE